MDSAEGSKVGVGGREGEEQFLEDGKGLLC